MKKYLLLVACLVSIVSVRAQIADEITILNSATATFNPPPADFSRVVKFHFVWNGAIGAPQFGGPGIGTYSGLMTIAPWSDGTGSKHHQLNFNEQGLYWRKGAMGSSWENWQRLLVQDTYGSVSWGNTGAKLTSNQGGSIELRGDVAQGLAFPHIDFSNDPSEDYDMRLILQGDNVLNIDGGSVGIGTNNPGTYKLAVEGKLGAREIIVTTSPWADYVFEADYKLPSLSEVEAFIKKYKHLPEVPTTAEVNANGVNVGEVSALLLKKIEELTLYVIELKKENEEIKKQLKNGINK